MEASIHNSFVKPCPSTPQRYALGELTMNGVTAGDGRPIVFIHGLGWDYSLWGGAMTRFSGDYLTIAGDTRGHGATDKPEGPYSVDIFAKDWAELIGELATEKVLIVGFSLGGMIAQTLALDYPDLVGALVLVNTSCRSPLVGSAHLKERMEVAKRDGPAAAAMLAAKSVFSPSWRDANPAMLADFVDWRVAQDQRALGEVMRAASNFDLRDRVGALDVPTMIMTSLGDEMMPPSDQALLTEMVPAAEYVAFADAGHMLQLERPEPFESTLESFLRRHWPSDGNDNTKLRTDIKDAGERITIRGSTKDLTL
jgi:3-oxoadipate enol-lactonase